MSYSSILNEYVNDYCDNTLIELEENKKSIESLDDLLDFLNFACDHNYWTGHYWVDLYNYNNELEDIVNEFISDEQYFNYIVEFCDRKADIFILSDSSELIAIESENKYNPVMDYIFDKYNYLLSPDEFENIVYYNEEAAVDYVNVLYQIPDLLEPYIDYAKIIRDFAHDSLTTLVGQCSFINDYN